MNDPDNIGYEEALWRIAQRKNDQGSTLSLKGLGLNRIPPEIGELEGLWLLDLSENRLNELPSMIGNLRSLFRLRCANNQFAEFPHQILNLKALYELDLGWNEITELPPELELLKELRFLHLNNNKINTLPQEIGLMQSLQTLRLENNRLQSLPRSFLGLNSLTQLFLHGNANLGLPETAYGPTWNEVANLKANPGSPRTAIDYLNALEEQGEAPIQEVRLLAVGRGRVGKTSLLKTLQSINPDPYEPETPGITVFPLNIECSRGTARGHVWDFGGQEFLHGTHQIFLSGRCVYLLVLEGREGNWELETNYWLKFIQSYGGNSPVIIALNKYDSHPFSVDVFRLKEKYPQIVDFIETDAFTNRGIDLLKIRLESTVGSMADVWLSVPKKWHMVKEDLANMADSYLEYSGYQAMCVRHGITETEAQASLAETLHQLGLALNFRDHQRLRKTSVLKPKWVTEGIYGLIRYAQKQDCHGVFEETWIGEALPKNEYPFYKHRFLMELMEKFEVAFLLDSYTDTESSTVPRGPKRWLIPELLPEVQPAEFLEFRTVEARRVRFNYPQALPPGLLPRLIVRTHEMSMNNPTWRWRSGVVLDWGEARALVRLDRNERRTEVIVIGTNMEDRQALFDLLRAHLSELHGNVSVVEEVQALDDPDKWIPMMDLRVAEQASESEMIVTVGFGIEARRIKLPISEILDRVESQDARLAQAPDSPARFRLFVSYAHHDSKLIHQLSKHLTILSRRGYIQPWDDRQLIAGEEWETRILEEIARADIILLLYSSASRASSFIQEREIPAALKAHRTNNVTLIVVPLDRNDWDAASPLEKELQGLQTATWNAKAVFDYKPQRKGWLEVETALRFAVELRRKQGDSDLAPNAS